MAFDIANFTQVCNILAKIDLFGCDLKVRPNLNTAASINTAVTSGGAHMPLMYRDTYAAALNKELKNIMLQLKDVSQEERVTIIEQFYAPVYEHAKLSGMRDVRPELHRFLAVVSNLFRSFINANKRTALNVPLVTVPPPLAFFQCDGNSGPYTITSESMQKLFGTPVAVVSLPASYRNHGLLWCSLAHEVCGHDVVHADPGLVPELVQGVRTMFCGPSFSPNGPLTPNLLNALLWSHWIDEAAADVYGVLNMGPTFALNLAAFFSAMVASIYARTGRPVPPMPYLRSTAGPRDPRSGDNHMDEHPVDILRLHLAIGVIESLPKLAPAKKAEYIAAIEAVAKAAGRGNDHVRVQGEVKITRHNWRMIDEKIPLAEAQEAARRAGSFLASTKLEVLNKHSIQEIETWDDADEATAQGVADAIFANRSIVGGGDDAQMLAGCNIAIMQRPELYEQMTKLLHAGLDESFDRDPIWGKPKPNYVIVPGAIYNLEDPEPSAEQYADITQQSKPAKKSEKKSADKAAKKASAKAEKKAASKSSKKSR